MAGAWYVHILQGRVSSALADNVTSIRAALRLQLAIQRDAATRSINMRYPRDRSFLNKAAGSQRERRTRAAGEVTHFASTEYEFGIVDR